MGLSRRFALIEREKNAKKVKTGVLEQAYLRVKFSLKGGVSSLDRKLSILRGFIPRQLCGGKKFALKLPREPVSGFLGIAPAHSNKFPLERASESNSSSKFQIPRRSAPRRLIRNSRFCSWGFRAKGPVWFVVNFLFL
jgi:hypothetical protein